MGALEAPLSSPAVTVFLCGDVMTGRGIDQILPTPSDPRLYEPVVQDAREYVELAERVSGPIPRPVELDYVWGDALAAWERWAPDVRLINLETSVTTSDEAWPKGINYRMHPANVGCLNAAKIACCTLANNHVLDWGRAGLLETVDVLRRAGLATAGAGRDQDEAEAPAILDWGGGRVLVFSFGSVTSGIPYAWAASPRAPGVALLGDLSPRAVDHVAARVAAAKRPGDIVIASIHWGGNWGHEVPWEQAQLARALVDEAGVDVVHGHSSHHPKAIEIHSGRVIFYGCGDFLNDYEGISGHEDFRGDLVLMYLATLAQGTGELIELRMVPLQIRRLRLNRVEGPDAWWHWVTLNRDGARFGTRVEPAEEGTLLLRWR